MKTVAWVALLLAAVFVSLSGCDSLALSSEESHATPHSESHAEGHGEAHIESHGGSEHHLHKVIVTSPVKRNIVTTRPYVCQIHSCQHIEVRALEGGYLQEIHVQEGQSVKKGDLMFKILPILYQARVDSEVAEVNRLEIELQQAEGLLRKGIVAPPEIALKKAELAKAQAKVALERAELSFTSVTAPFDGIVDRQMCQLGSLIEEGDVLTTLSDNRVMWVYFNVPEARYLEYQAELTKSAGEVDDDADDDGDDEEDDLEEDGDDDDEVESDDAEDRSERLQIELKLANGEIFPQKGNIGAIEADFDNTTGNIPFRADFPNPEGLLRNGQTGTILMHTILNDALIIPQRAKFEILAKQYVFVVDDEGVVHQRDIEVEAVQDDIFVIGEGLEEGDKIVLEGIRQVRPGDKIEYEYQAPEDVLGDLKYHAE